MVTGESGVHDFESARPMMRRVAYQMLGSVAEAEDVVQDAWLRWSNLDRGAISAPHAYLRRTVVNLCMDRLTSARARRETYPGPWLPEPVFEPEPVSDVTLPLLLALERLSPLERAALLLHDVFGESFDAVALALGRTPAACRQLASRARDNIRSPQRRFEVDHARGREIAEAFLEASRMGDTATLAKLLAEDVQLFSDGGGKRPALTHVVEGAEAVVRTLMVFAGKISGVDRLRPRYGWINGLPGIVTEEGDGFPQSTALLTDGRRIQAIYVVRNPDKLRHLR